MQFIFASTKAKTSVPVPCRSSVFSCRIDGYTKMVQREKVENLPDLSPTT
jgi:hypothetical protein